MNHFTITAAFLIALVYINFLRNIDLFERERRRHTLACFFLGMAFLYLLYPLNWIYSFQSILPMDGPFLVRLRFHILAVASYEELVKILPLLIMLSRKGIVNESVDYLKYASIGALGFATIENIDYFNKFSLHIAEGRAFYTAVLHMFTSSIIGYFLMQSKIRWKLPSLIAFLPGYLIAISVHGLFNALASHANTYYLAVVLIILILVVWGRMFNNALNQSEFFTEDPSVKGKIVRAGVVLVFGWAVIFLFVAFSIYSTEGETEAWLFLREGFPFGFLSGGGLIYTLARPKLRKGVWAPLFKRS
jgi:RsiW-degrading membrane proteinase PrsW (M82 family)